MTHEPFVQPPKSFGSLLHLLIPHAVGHGPDTTHGARRDVRVPAVDEMRQRHGQRHLDALVL